MADPIQKFKRIGIVGAGNMGTSMSFGFAEQGLDVSLWEIRTQQVDQAVEMSKGEKGLKGKVEGFHDIHEFTKSLEVAERKLFIFSITHGQAADSVLSQIKDSLKEGDIILDGGNEYYRNTERRQKELEPLGVDWIGMGVSGGYQSARRGPSMSLGGNKKTVDDVLPLLEKFAARDAKGNPCVANMGPRGAGHYVKMLHNGIEQGILSATCEAWSLLHKSLGLSNDEIGKVFEKWNAGGELRNTYLLEIGAEICQRKKTPKGDGRGEGVGTSGYVLDDVLDKVVQDDDDSEGTLYWSVMEAADRHVSTPTLAASHFLRVASGDRDQRLRVGEKINVPSPQKVSIEEKEAFIETLRRAVYASYLCSFTQGLELIARASRDEDWKVDLGTCIQIWREGCIIRSDYIADLLQPILSSPAPIMNLKLIDEVSAEFHKNFQQLKELVLKATEWDAYIPSMSASLEYLKYCGGTALPTQFMEAEMDFFGAHAFDRWRAEGEDPGSKGKGKHHYEWRPA